MQNVTIQNIERENKSSFISIYKNFWKEAFHFP